MYEPDRNLSRWSRRLWRQEDISPSKGKDNLQCSSSLYACLRLGSQLTASLVYIHNGMISDREWPRMYPHAYSLMDSTSVLACHNSNMIQEWSANKTLMNIGRCVGVLQRSDRSQHAYASSMNGQGDKSLMNIHCI